MDLSTPKPCARSARKSLWFLDVIRAETIQKREFFECGFSHNLIVDFWHRGFLSQNQEFNCGQKLIVDNSPKVHPKLIVDSLKGGGN